jgi:uncharacterized glyoxalase superfamily protein PhnB
MEPHPKEDSMPDNPPNDMPTIYPTLSYRDAPAAIDWLARAFGFRPLLVVPGPDGTIAHAEMAFGTGVIMLGTTKAGTDQIVTNAPYVYVADVDSHERQARAAGAEITRELEDTDYGARVYSVRDLEGNVWSFGTYVPNPIAEEATAPA